MTTRTRLAAFLIGFALLPTSSGTFADSPPPVAAAPTALIDGFHATLLGVMKEAKTLGVRGRYERLEPAVGTTFSLPLMIRIASGTTWTKGTDEERQKLVAAFERLSIATYADRFDGYSGESFTTTGSKPGPQGTTLVETKLNRPKDQPVDLVYVIREIEGAPRVVDVLLESGVSELARYRSDYAAVLKSDGLGGLTTELEAKVAKLLDDGKS